MFEWNTQLDLDDKPKINGKLMLTWNRPRFRDEVNRDDAEIRICMGMHKKEYFEAMRDWVAFYGIYNKGEFQTTRTPLQKNYFLRNDGSRRFCGRRKDQPELDQDSSKTGITITSSSIVDNEAIIEFERY